MNIFKIIVMHFAVICLVVPLSAQSDMGKHKQISCSEFVQNFYDWYLQIYMQDNDIPAAEIALRKRPNVFSSGLYHAMRDDFNAQKLAADGISGLDFDPFLSGQDAQPQYKVIKTIVKSSNCVAEVNGVGPDWKHKGKIVYDPKIMISLRYENSKWTFLNFKYVNRVAPATNNLLEELKWWRDIRKKKKLGNNK